MTHGNGHVTHAAGHGKDHAAVRLPGRAVLHGAVLTQNGNLDRDLLLKLIDRGQGAILDLGVTNFRDPPEVI